jgi:predicted enzyme related to lactoylglutathione lyase
LLQGSCSLWLIHNDLDNKDYFTLKYPIYKYENQVMTGDEKTPMINDGLMQASGGFTGTINTVEVEDIDAALAKALAHGGEVVLPKDAIPGVGYQAYIKDNAGIIIGLHQADPKAGMG